METALIIIIVGLAAAYLMRRFYRSLQQKDETPCGCGCSSCPAEQNCEDFSSKGGF